MVKKPSTIYLIKISINIKKTKKEKMPNYTLFNNIKVGNIIANSFNLEKQITDIKASQVITDVFTGGRLAIENEGNKPAAAAGNENQFYLHKTNDTLQISDGSAWSDFTATSRTLYFYHDDGTGANDGLYKVVFDSAGAKTITIVFDASAAATAAVAGVHLDIKTGFAVEMKISINTNVFAIDPHANLNTTALTNGQHFGVRETVGGLTDIHIYKFNSADAKYEPTKLEAGTLVQIKKQDNSQSEQISIIEDTATTSLLFNGVAANTAPNNVDNLFNKTTAYTA